jgi:general stress protein 26
LLAASSRELASKLGSISDRSLEVLGTDVVTPRLMNSTTQAHPSMERSEVPLDLGDRKAHAREVLKELGTVMLLTIDRHLQKAGEHPHFHARPMAVAEVDADCTLWFVTSIDSSKIDEALTPYDGHASAQTRTRQAWITGTFSVVRDPDQIRVMWKKEYEVWFPEGPTDPKVCLLGLHPREVEFWDASGTKGLKYFFDSAKALVTGHPPQPISGQHDKVRLV